MIGNIMHHLSGAIGSAKHHFGQLKHHVAEHVNKFGNVYNNLKNGDEETHRKASEYIGDFANMSAPHIKRFFQR
jgi:hemerythrin-like domain-containing protein